LPNDENVRTYRILTSADEQIFSFLRKHNEREVLVILNLSANENIDFEMTDERISGAFKNVFPKELIDFPSDGSFSMKAWEYFVYTK
jgi:glycosidase